MKGKSGPDACDHTIQRLIKRVARRLFKDGNLSPSIDQLQSDFPASKASLPEYYQLERFADREEYHARLQIFINAEAVTATWDRGAGEHGQLERITLISPEAAANILGIRLPWAIAEESIRELNAIIKYPSSVVERILDEWKHGRSPGGVGADKANQFIDSIRVIDVAKKMGASAQDQLLRRVSVQLFGDSKRIEALSRQIAFLLDEPEGSPDDHREDIFARLGLVKHPQPILISGPSTCQLTTKEGSTPLLRPYIGLRPDTIKKLLIGEKPIQKVLTIENLASFNEAAQDMTNPDDLIIIYVAGNPTPSLLNTYGKILESIKPVSVFHWGDIDVGGFRIASRVAERAHEMGHKLQLWKMNPAVDAKDQSVGVSDRQISMITEICNKYGWSDEAAGIRQHPVFQEQEFINWHH